jgi:hypothetical protein
MPWAPSLYTIVAGVVDLRAFDDDGVAFVRANFKRLGAEKLELDDLEYQLRAMGQLRREFAVELLIRTQKNVHYVVAMTDDRFTSRAASEADVNRYTSRGGVDFRLPAHGYSVDRLAEVEAVSRRRDPRDVAWLIDRLKLASQPTPSEEALRRALYDAMAWHDTPEVREVLLRSLASEGDDMAACVIGLVYRIPALVDQLPARIDTAWRARDERLATRLMQALLKSDDEGKHHAWATTNYPALVRRLQ